MKTKIIVLKVVLLFAILFGFTFLFTSWQLRSQQQNSTPPPTKSTFPTDDTGRAVPLQKPAQRVAVIGPGAIETIFKMGLGSRIVGRDQFADFPPEISTLPIIGNYTGPFYEKIIATYPDLVIMQGETWNNVARLDHASQKIGVPIAALNATNVQALIGDIEKIGAWLGAASKADKLVQPLQKLLANAPPQKVTAFVEIGRTPLWTAGKGSLVSEVIELSGFRNVANVKGYKQFSMESLLALNPDVYIVPSKIDDTAKVLSALRKDAQLSKLPAIQAGRVIVIDGDYLLRPGPRIEMGIKQLRTEAEKYAE